VSNLNRTGDWPAINPLISACSRLGAHVSAALAVGLLCSIPANSEGLPPGAAPIRYEKIAGPVSIVGDNERYQVLISGQVLFEDRSWYYSIVAAFPDWNNPSLVVFESSPGGNATCPSFEVLDVKTGKKSESFGVCSTPVIFVTKDELVFAFHGTPSFIGYAYGAKGLVKIPNLTPDQHIKNGVAAYTAKSYGSAIRHFWLVYGDQFPESPFYLGLMAHLGNGLRQNYAVAMAYYKASAELDFAPAYFRIGILHANGRGVPTNPKEAMQFYMKAANLGDAVAQFNVGLGFLTGVGIEKDVRKGLFWMLVASDRLTDQKVLGDAQKNIQLAQQRLDSATISSIQFGAASWKPIIPTKWIDPNELKAFVGKYPFERVRGRTLFEVPEVRSRVQMLPGSNGVKDINQLAASPPVEERSGWLVAHGCQPHACPWAQWAIAINLSDYNVFVCFGTEGNPAKYAATGKKAVEQPPKNENPCPEISDALSTFQRVFSPPLQSAQPAPAAPIQAPPIARQQQSPKLTSTGSGVFVNSEGDMVTNYHVIDGCADVKIGSNTGQRHAVIVASDEANDLAILHTDIVGIEPLPFRDGRGIRAGDEIVLVGFPYSGLLTSSPNVSVGAVSALAGMRDDTRFLQISAPVQPGNSGGPLLDLSGSVVGVVVATINASAVLKITGSVPQNVNFAIKSSLAREFLDAKRISFKTSSAGAKIDTADVGEKGSRSTVLVECYK